MVPIVSIIIPHFNRVELLKQTIESVNAQTYPHWEIVIVDDRSTTEQWKSMQLLSSDKIRIFQRESPIKGPSVCRNTGADLAAGQYLIFLDADDLLAPHCLEQRISAIQNAADLDAGVFLMQQFENEPGNDKGLFNLFVNEGEWISSFLKNDNPWQTMCPIWKKDSFLQTGGFDEALVYMEDPELHLRALHVGMRFKTFYNLPPDCFYRVHHFDETKKDFYYNSILYRIRFYRKLTSGLYPEQFLKKYQKDIKIGANKLIRSFLYSRKNDFPDLYDDLMDWIKHCGLFSIEEILRYKILLSLGNSTNGLLKRMRIKGICYRLLPQT